MSSLVTVGIDDPRWRSLLAASPDACAFHHPAWVGLLADCYGFRPFVAAVEGDGGLRAGVPVLEVRRPLGPRRWVSLPFSDHCAVLATAGADRAELVRELATTALAAGVRSIELRDPTITSGSPGAPRQLVHRLPLADPAVLRAGVHPSHRRNVRAALRNGVSVRRGTEASDLVDRFYPLHVETRRRHGTPVQPRRYFRLLWERILAPGLGRLLLAEHDGRPVAGVVLLTWSSTAVYKYGASDASTWALRPNDLLMWHAIEEAAGEGFSTFDFGRTAPSNDGLSRFKRGWGAAESELVPVVLGAAGRTVSVGEVGGITRRVLQRAPRAGVRVAGALFYRFAA